MTTRKPNTARANFVALAADAPGAIPGHLTGTPTNPDHRPRYFDPEDPETRARNTFLAAANDAPGALVGALGCPCPTRHFTYIDKDMSFLSALAECPQHGDRVRRMVMAARTLDGWPEDEAWQPLSRNRAEGA